MKVAIICAIPRFSNTGMRFVDSSISIVFENYDCFALDPERLESKEDSENYSFIGELNVKEYDKIVVWGDFILSKHWLTAIKKYTKLNNPLDYLFSKLLECPEKVCLFGGTIMTNIIEDYADAKYSQLFKLLLTQVGYASFRDPISFHHASNFAENNKINPIGIDPAMLHVSFENNIYHRKMDVLNVGFFWGRSKKAWAGKLRFSFFIRWLKHKNFASDIKWIPWLSEHKKIAWYYKLILGRHAQLDISCNIKELKRKLSDFDVIITDTYHLSVMCLTLGIPVLCFGHGDKPMLSSLDDKKKELLFHEYGLQQYYLFNSKLIGLSNKEVYALLNNLITSNSSNIVRKRIHRKTQRCIKSLKCLEITL
jgi:hypothetical protein